MENTDHTKRMIDEMRREKLVAFFDETGMKPYALEDLAGVGRGICYGILRRESRKVWVDTWNKIVGAMESYRAVSKAS